MTLARFLRTLVLAIVFLTPVSGVAFADVPTTTDFNLRQDAKTGVSRAGYIDGFKSGFGNYFFGGTYTGERGAKYLMVTIARDLKNLFMFIAVVYLFITVIRLLFSGGGDEDAKKWRQSIIWTSIGIVVMQISYVFISTLFDRQVVGFTASIFAENIVYPFVKMLQLLASFAFLAMAFYAFYLIVTAGGEEDKIKKGKSTIIYALIGFLIMKVPWVLVTSIYGKAECSDMILGICQMKISDPNLSDTTRIMTKLINYFNSFVALIIILLIIYAGYLIVLSGWDDEKVKKAKNIIKYAIMGVFLLVASYILFNFFVLKG